MWTTNCAVVIDPPETQYARTSDGAHIAYQVLGDGPVDLSFVSLGGSHVDLAWEVTGHARVFRRLASFSRLIRFDHRGMGMSDPLGLSEQPSLEGRAKDMLAVLDAAGSEKVAVMANGTGGLVAAFFAATYPNRTAALVLDRCYARLARAPDYPWGVPNEVLEQALSRVNSARVATLEPFESMGMRYTAPNAMHDAEFVAQSRRYYPSGSSPGALRAESSLMVYADVRPLLSAIQAPTLVLHRRDDRWVRPPHAEYLAAHIAGSKLVELPGQDNLIYVGDPDADIDEIEEFLTGARHAPATNRVLATVLFTDIVSSTDRAASLGDRKWRDLLDAHDAVIRRQLERFQGHEVNTTGDGFQATFDGPGRAIKVCLRHPGCRSSARHRGACWPAHRRDRASRSRHRRYRSAHRGAGRRSRRPQ